MKNWKLWKFLFSGRLKLNPARRLIFLRQNHVQGKIHYYQLTTNILTRKTSRFKPLRI